MLLLLISFIAGILTVLAPCILPLLPVIIGHSITDTTPSRRGLFVVVASLGISVILFTLLLKASSLLIDIPQDFWKWISGGVIFILVAIAIISGYDKKLQISLLDAGFLDVTKIEQKLLEKNDKKDVSINGTSSTDENTEVEDKARMNEGSFLSIKEKNKKFALAPDISTPDGFINTNNLPITISEFKGKKVVLLDIWTYSCINCHRTIPYLNEWHKKYEDEGLVIIGLHTPEFSFEKIQKNVEKAVKDFGIEYPVVLDNDFSTWNAYENRYWPRKYLIDIDGYIVYDHAGEGQYRETEVAIQKALGERVDRLNMNMAVSSNISKPSGVISVDSGKVKSGEVYFGSARNEYLENGRAGISGEQVFSLPQEISFNKLYLDGIWDLTSEYAENKNISSIIFNYEARNVYMTAGSTLGVEVEIYKDDVFVKKITIKDETLYSVIEDSDYGRQ